MPGAGCGRDRASPPALSSHSRWDSAPTLRMFGVADRLLFRPPPYLRDPGSVHRVYMSWTVDRERELDRGTSVAAYLDFVHWTHRLSPIAAFWTWKIAVGEGAETHEWPVSGVSASYFDLFDAQPTLGRFFGPSEDVMPMGSPVVVLSYAYWQSAMGGRSDVLGRQLRVGRMLFTVIGVAPDGFVGVGDDDIPAMYVPITAFVWNARPLDRSQDYSWYGLELLVRRPPSTSIAAANADLTAAFQRIWLARNAAEGHDAVPIESARPQAVLGPVRLARGPQAGPEDRVLLWVTAVAAVVLLIACANVANLLLARAMARRREITVRVALGVSHARLTRQILTESLVLAGAGAIVGMGVAELGGGLVRRLFLLTDPASSILSDHRTLLVLLAATVATTVLTGIAPAIHVSRADLAAGLNAGARGTTGRSSGARAALLFVQATLSVVLLVGAGLFVRSFANVRAMHLGFDVDPLIVVMTNSRGTRMTPPEEVALERRVTQAADAIPGVVATSPAASIPFSAFEGHPLYVAGIDSVDLLGDFYLQAGNPDYFRTVGTRIVRGRGFTEGDRANAPRVMVVSDGMARALWPAVDPLGRCIRIDSAGAPCTSVVGIAEDLHIRSLTARREYTYYLPITQYGQATNMQLVRAAGPAGSYTDVVRRQLQQVMPGAAYVTAVPLRAMVDPKFESWRFGATMFVAFGLLALAVAAIGLYSMIAYGVAQQRREIGVRIALGARRRHVLTTVGGAGLRVVLAGLAVGSLIAVWAGKRVADLLFEESPTDPFVYAVVAAVLVLVAIVATAVPVSSATRVDPTVSLWTE